MDHLLALGSTMARFSELAGRARGDESVPSCPGWTVDDLTAHLGTIHRWAAAIVLSGQRLDKPVAMIGEPIAEWYAGTATALLGALQAVSPDEPVPNFARIDERAHFWHRRQLHETTVHTVDLAQALGLGRGEWSVDAELAADGIDEVLTVHLPRRSALGRDPDVRGRVRLIATDTGQSWLVGPGDDSAPGPAQLFGGDDSDTVARGTAADLYLALWHRLPAGSLAYDGGGDARALFEGVVTP